jgi:hypothetical protein
VRLGAVVVACGFLLLTGCGGGTGTSNPGASAQTPPTTLTGNWFLAGSRVPAAYPTLSTALHVQGNIITGEMAFLVQCTSAGVTSGISSSSFAINGTIANDGTFQASTGTIGGGTQATISISLTGNSPLPATPSVWTGAYSLVFASGSTGTPCNAAQSASFTATPIAPVTGTYIGVPVNPGSFQEPFGAGAVVSVQITQGTPTLVTRGPASTYPIPLTANLTIANSPCAFSGSTTGIPEPSSISGDSFVLFLTAGFPYGVLSGTLNDPTATTFFGDLTSLAQANGCAGIAFYNFTRM